MECNVTSHVKIAHLFFTRMMERKLRGAIAFTSSQVPPPCSCLTSVSVVVLLAWVLIRPRGVVCMHEFILHGCQSLILCLTHSPSLNMPFQTAFFPSPGAAMYCAGKAFLTAFAGCLAIEGRGTAQNFFFLLLSSIIHGSSVVGIDVTVLMSGPMRTRFYEHAPKLDVFKFFRI